MFFAWSADVANQFDVFHSIFSVGSAFVDAEGKLVVVGDPLAFEPRTAKDVKGLKEMMAKVWRPNFIFNTLCRSSTETRSGPQASAVALPLDHALFGGGPLPSLQFSCAAASSVQLRRCLFSLALFGSSFSGSLLLNARCDCVKLKSQAPHSLNPSGLSQLSSLSASPPLSLSDSLSLSQRRHTFVVPQDPKVAIATAHHWSLLHGSTTDPCPTAIVDRYIL
ncbi:hypothetical protein NE237_018765 [Protea cynaroides]|uniref:Uncharacterized protein n=1 Tax=Protea cynaroides TaxID=273540 RepID=A0A9Q0KAQ4_9MAGN|nr:hypothetical protein NE237_018765 [Protea cynaroides]